jgi:hypothetical protein
MAAIWQTTSGSIGTAITNQTFSYQLDAYDTNNNPLVYSLISGSLPSNISLYSNGLINGTALPMADDQQNTSIQNPYQAINSRTFVVRAQTRDNLISDRTFTLYVTGIDAVTLLPSSTSLGTYVTGDYANIQLYGSNPVPDTTIIYSLTPESDLPYGVNLSLIYGNITGYIFPANLSANAALTGFDMSDWGTYIFDFSGVDESKEYKFSVTAQNDTQYWNRTTQNYSVYVYGRNSLTADNDIITADNDLSSLTADTSSRYSPILLTNEGLIGNTRSNDNFIFKFNAVDFNNDTLTYDIVSGSLPTGITLSANTGYITGSTVTANLGYTDYNFDLKVYKTDQPEYESETKPFTLRLLGTADQSLTWITSSDLGTIYAGEVSDMQIQAEATSGRNLYYRLAQTSVGSLPAGLELLPNGLIIGRPSWDPNSYDDNNIYTFTVEAYDAGGLNYSEKEFSFEFIKRTLKPYQNLYVQLLPSRAQREYYQLVVNNDNVIPEETLYRSNDPWFGRNTLRRMLFLYGLNPKDTADYIDSMTLNHYWKTLRFGQIKTAKATDDNINTIYEVVYIEILETDVNQDGDGPGLSQSWPQNNYNITSVYPNTFNNMSSRIISGINYLDKGVLPKWMTSRQDDGSVLGFTRALVLAYLKPGYGQEISFRLNAANLDFNLIDFTIDRYEWDNILNENFVINPLTGSGTITANIQSNTVIGSSTSFDSELAEGATILVANVVIGTVNTIANSSVLTLLANATSNISAQNFTYNNLFIINNYISSSGNITANTSSNIVVGTTGNVVCTGVITATTNNVYVTGSNTDFGNELSLGSNIVIAGSTYGVVERIYSNSNLALVSTPLSNVSITSFSTNVVGTNFNQEIRIGDSIVVANVVIGQVQRIDSNLQLILTSNSTSNISDQAFSRTYRNPVTEPSEGDVYLKFPQVNILS